MWSTATITISILFICGLQAAPLATCPNSCTCVGTEFYCNSFTFIPKLSHHEITEITKLVINNTTASKNPKLNNFLNLRTLSLASNKIKQLNSFYFPQSLQYLDLTNNFLTLLPQDFLTALKELKELRLSGNPISCTCDSIAMREHLLRRNVTIVTPVKCHSPENLFGKSWLTVSCIDGLFGEMQGDAPYEGSGFDETIESSSDQDKDKSVEEEFIRVDSSTQTANVEVIQDEEEGSGGNDSTTPLIILEDDDSEIDTEDDIPVSESPVVKVNDLLLNNVKACNFDCSTPEPTPANNDTDELPPPGVFEGVKIVWDDFSVLKGSESSTTTEPPVSVSVESNKNITGNKDAEMVSKPLDEKDKGSITETPKQSNSSTYIFLGALLVLIIVLVIYAVIKKRSAKRRSHNLHEPDERSAVAEGVELTKAIDHSKGPREAVPLMNGNSDNDAKTYDNVDVRKKPNQGIHARLLFPEARRVTIRAREIPNSTPKTPLLVTRHVNSEGTVITTPALIPPQM